MTLQMAKVIVGKNGWYIRCPECRTRTYLEECPIPGGMVANVEICHECGAYIEVQPRKND